MSIQVYKGEILVSEPELAKTQWEKAKGLMFSKQHDVLFHFSDERRLKFHMVFVFYPIDIVFLDSDLKVVDLKPKFRPFTFYYSKAASSTVIESYDGFINDHSIKVGDELSIVHEGEINMPSDAPPTPPAFERKNVFHGTSLGKRREAEVRPVETTASSDASGKTTKAAKKPAKASKRPAKKAPAKSKSAKKAPAKTSTKTKTTKRSSAKSKTSAKPSQKSSKASSKKSKTTKKTSARTKSAKKPAKATKKSSASKKSKSAEKSTKKSSKTTAKKPSKSKTSKSKTSKKSNAKKSKK